MYKAEDFDKMVKEQKADVVIVTTIDKFHHVYCILCHGAGLRDAITEKPMTIDEEKLQAMIDAEKRTGKQALSARFRPCIWTGSWTAHMDPIFMRRWHRNKDTSGGIQMHKSIHHFDLVHYWLNTEPENVYCVGSLRFYGKENAERRGERNLGERYLNNEAAKDDPFAIHIDQNAQLKKLYLEAEHEDGYIVNRNCFAEGITIEDNLSMVIKYKNKAVMTYNTKGRIEINVVEGGYSAGGETITNEGLGELEANYIQGGVEKTNIVVYPLWAKPYVVDANWSKAKAAMAGETLCY
ncbi:unnamed protein product [Alternaria alternata]